MTTHSKLTPAQRDAIERGLRETYFAWGDKDYLASPTGVQDLEDHVEGRYRLFGEKIVPWIARHTDLAGKVVVEIGCGTGSSTAALAPAVQAIHAYELAETSAAACRRRLQALGIDNVEIQTLGSLTIQHHLERTWGERGVDIILLFAVLEHMSLGERLVALGNAWKLLKPGGLLIIGETPNRLVYSDSHTSRLPFYNTLPDDLALLYANRSERKEFVEDIALSQRESPIVARDRLVRWGRGVSFHEFEIVMGDLTGLVVGDGFDLWDYGVLEEELLLRWFDKAGVKVVRGFARQHLDMILRKPVDAPGPGAGPTVTQLAMQYGLANEERIFRGTERFHAGDFHAAHGDLLAACTGPTRLSPAVAEQALTLLVQCWERIGDRALAERALDRLEICLDDACCIEMYRATLLLRCGAASAALALIRHVLSPERGMPMRKADWAFGILEDCWRALPEEAAAGAALLGSLEARFGDQPWFPIHRAAVRIRGGRARDAERELIAILREPPVLGRWRIEWAFSLLDQCWEQLDDGSLASAGSEALRPRWKDDSAWVFLNALSALRQGRRDAGIELVGRTLKVEPGHQKAEQLLRELAADS